MIDKDNKGYVTREEFLNFQERFFDRMDQDHDGKVDADEWMGKRKKVDLINLHRSGATKDRQVEVECSGVSIDSRVAQPFGFALTDPSVRFSRTRLFPKVTRVMQREPRKRP